MSCSPSEQSYEGAIIIIIGLTGLKGSGKDTVAAYLIKEYGYERRAFADKLKVSAAALLDILPHEFEAMKNDPDAVIVLGSRKQLEAEGAAIFLYDGPRLVITVREFLQRYGTESHRDVFGANFWVDQVLPVAAYYGNRDIVITDVRFFSEAKRISEIGGYVVRVERPSDTKDHHRSEVEQQGIAVNYILHNDGAIEDIPWKVDEMLKELGVRSVGV